MSYLGIDLGTSGLRALLTDGDGTAVASAERHYEVQHPHSGWSEQDPADWIAALEGAVEELRRQPAWTDLRGIGVAGHMHGAVMLGADGRVRRDEPIPVEHGPMVHDCMITPKYVIVMDLPVTFSMSAIISGMSFPYRWNENHKARIGLLPREGSADDIIWCDVDPCYIFHPANAYETEDGKVVMDACVYDHMFAPDNTGPDGVPKFESLTIDPATRTVSRRVIDDRAHEFPRYDERLTGKPYRYVYTTAVAADGFLTETRIFKHDLTNGSCEVRDFGSGRVPGEFIFIPASETASEDEGWLMGYVVDTNAGLSELVILDAANFTAPAVATVHIPQRIPQGFHGNFIPVG